MEDAALQELEKKAGTAINPSMTMTADVLAGISRLVAIPVAMAVCIWVTVINSATAIIEVTA